MLIQVGKLARYNNDPYHNLRIDDDRLLDGADFHKQNQRPFFNGVSSWYLTFL